jgi:hypothetical protein
VTFTVAVTNRNPGNGGATQSATMTDAKPDNAVFAGFVSISQGSAAADGGDNINASFGNLPVGNTATLSWRVTAGQPGLILNIATAAGSVADPNPSNNTGTARVTVCRPGGGPGACLDPFLCYTAKTSKKTKPVTPQTDVHLQDAFAESDFDLTKPLHLCTPADVTGLAALDPDTQLASYRLKDLCRFRKRVGVTVENQLGTIVVDALKPDLLLVPSGKALTEPTVFTHRDTGVDHYTCYKVKISSGTSFPPGLQRDVGDQFTSPPTRFDIKGPTHASA